MTYFNRISDYILDCTTLWGFSKYNPLIWLQAFWVCLWNRELYKD